MMEDRQWNPANPKRPSLGQSEPLWEVFVAHHTHACELRDHGGFGVEAQIVRDGQFVIGRRFDTRAQAAEWAHLVRGDIEQGGQ